MARTINEIYNGIVASKQATPTLDMWDNASETSTWKFWAYIVAIAVWSLENLFDIHFAEVNQIIDDKRPRYIIWYRDKAEAYQHGFDLIADGIDYDNTGIDESVIEASKVVKYAAAIGVLKGLRLKVAREVSGELEPLTSDQLSGLKAYMFRIAAPGTRIYYVNSPADSLKLKLQVYYNAMVLNGSGQRLDGTNPTPVQDAVKAFLKNQPFNGLFVLSDLVDYLKKVPGVIIPHIVEAKAQYGLLAYMIFGVSYLPDAGYLRLVSDSDLEIEFIVQEPYQ